jgi:hypothetical protein
MKQIEGTTASSNASVILSFTFFSREVCEEDKERRRIRKLWKEAVVAYFKELY